MTKQKKINFKRLFIHIASVISIVSILLCSFSILVSAKNSKFDSLSLYGYKGDYVMREFGVGHGYNSNPPTGTNGTIIHRSTRYALKDNQFICYANNIDYADIDVSITAKPNGLKFIYIQLQFNENYYFYSGVNYSVSLPMQLVFYNYGTPSTDNGIYGKIRQDKLSLIRHETDRNYYYDVWDITNISLTSDWTFTLDFNFTPGQDFDCNGMLFGFNFVPFVDNPGLGEIIISDSTMNPLTITPRPVYTMPDFSEKDNIDNSERNWINNNGDSLGFLNNYFSGFSTLSRDFERLLTPLSRFTLLFNSVIVRNGSVFNDILAFSVAIGISALLINVIGNIGSFTTSISSKFIGRGGKK